MAAFCKPQPDLAGPWYDLRLCGTGAGPLEGDGAAEGHGLSLRTRYGLDDLVGADTVIVPSVPDACVEEGRPLPRELITALRRAHDAGARMVSLCTGAFALAEAGPLDGRRATALVGVSPGDHRRAFPAARGDGSGRTRDGSLRTRV